jgi:5'(3')-deoxyribonucleotidase
MLIGVDCDDTTLDLVPHWLSIYNAEFDDNLTPRDIKSWEIGDYVKPYARDRFFEYLREPYLYDGVFPVRGALRGVRKLLKMGHEVLFVTAGYNPAKLDCLKRAGFLENSWDAERHYVVLYYKYLLKLDVLIDDKFDTIRQFSGYGILFDRYWNRHCHWENRAKTWKQAVEIVKGLEIRHD